MRYEYEEQAGSERKKERPSPAQLMSFYLPRFTVRGDVTR